MSRNNRSDERPNHSKGGSYNKPHFNGFNILPSSKVLSEYESISEGSVNKLLDMAKKEQEHRHSWQDRYLKYHNLSYKSGQLCGAIYNILLLYIIYILIQSGNKGAALKLFIANTVLIIVAILVTYTERKLTTRKPPRRNGSDDTARSADRSPRKKFNPNQSRPTAREHNSREPNGNRKTR